MLITILGVVRRGFLLRYVGHWQLLVELILPLMAKFKYKTELFIDAFVNLTLLGYKFTPELVDLRTVPKQYEHLI